MEKTKVLFDVVCDMVEKEVINKIQQEKKKELPLVVLYNKNTYVNLDKFCDSTKEYYGFDSDSVKRDYYKKSILDYTGNKYIPITNGEDFAILSNNKLYINRDELDKLIFLYTLQRMDIKQIKDSYELELRKNKSDLISDMYNISCAHFQRMSPVYENVRVGHNSQSKITM